MKRRPEPVITGIMGSQFHVVSQDQSARRVVGRNIITSIGAVGAISSSPA